MGRRRTHAPLNVLINGLMVGRLEKDASSGVSFQYDQAWLDRSNAIPISLSLPLQKAAWRGMPVNAVFDNLLPDSPAVRKQVAEKTGAKGVDAYSLLEEIGRDCIGEPSVKRLASRLEQCHELHVLDPELRKRTQLRESGAKVGG